MDVGKKTSKEASGEAKDAADKMSKTLGSPHSKLAKDSYKNASVRNPRNRERAKSPLRPGRTDKASKPKPDRDRSKSPVRPIKGSAPSSPRKTTTNGSASKTGDRRSTSPLRPRATTPTGVSRNM